MTILKNKHSSHAANDLYDDVEKIKAALIDATHDVKCKARELLADSFQDVKDQTTAVKDKIENFAVDKPLQTAGIALLAGMVIGYLFNHK